MTHRFRYLFTIAACLIAAALLGACGGDDSETLEESSTITQSPGATDALKSKGTAVVVADLSSGAPQQETIEQLEQVVQARLGAGDVYSEISQTSDAEITIHYDGHRSEDFIRQLLTATNLNFREPVLQSGAYPTPDSRPSPSITAAPRPPSDAGDVRCRTDNGSEFSVPITNLSDSQDATGRPIKGCTSSNGELGEVEWQPATASYQGQTVTLDQSMIATASGEDSLSSSTGHVLVLQFTTIGQSLFADITNRLAGGYPIGMFLGDQILSAPSVQQGITSGSTQIENLNIEQIETLLAIIKGGALPVPVTVTSLTLD
jgi:hypothetical protein